MLDPKKLTPLGPGSFKYEVTSFKVFQLQINPVVSIGVENTERKIRMYVTESHLDGLGFVEDFDLTLDAILEANGNVIASHCVSFLAVLYPIIFPAQVLKNPFTNGLPLVGMVLYVYSIYDALFFYSNCPHYRHDSYLLQWVIME